MHSSIGRDNGPALKREQERLPYEAPKIVYQGKITIRAGSPIGGRIGPPGLPDSLPGS
jgi:hypothetical protein